MSGNKRIVVVGGVAAGPKAASKARRLHPNSMPIIIVCQEVDEGTAFCITSTRETTLSLSGRRTSGLWVRYSVSQENS